MTHLVSAFVSANQMVFGQLKVEAKSNEITAIPRLLELLGLKGCVITIDAMGCQKAIAHQIVEGGGDYWLGLKGNQSQLHEKVKNLMDEAILEKFAGMRHDFIEQVDGDHGRIEIRRMWCTPEVKWLGKPAGGWSGLGMLAAVESIRQVNGKTSTERRYYIGSRSQATAAEAAGDGFGVGRHRGHLSDPSGSRSFFTNLVEHRRPPEDPRLLPRPADANSAGTCSRSSTGGGLDKSVGPI